MFIKTFSNDHKKNFKGCTEIMSTDMGTQDGMTQDGLRAEKTEKRKEAQIQYSLKIVC